MCVAVLKCFRQVQIRVFLCSVFSDFFVFVPNLASSREPCRSFRTVDLLLPGGRGLFASECVGVLSLLMTGGLKTTRLMSELSSG